MPWRGYFEVDLSGHGLGVRGGFGLPVGRGLLGMWLCFCGVVWATWIFEVCVGCMMEIDAKVHFCVWGVSGLGWYSVTWLA